MQKKTKDKKHAVRLSKTDKFILEYCQKHQFKLLIDPELEKDDGLCYPAFREIHLAREYQTSSVKLACFLHECSHISVDRFKDRPYNNFECEFLAWHTAMKLHKKCFGRSFSKTQVQYMLRCLKSYADYAYTFKKLPDTHIKTELGTVDVSEISKAIPVNFDGDGFAKPEEAAV